MSANRIECSQCGTVNDPGRDTCAKCGAPLSASADEGLRTQVAAQEHGAVLAPEKEIAPTVEPTTAGTFGAPALLDADPTDQGAMSPPHEGRPLRRS